MSLRCAGCEVELPVGADGEPPPNCPVCGTPSGDDAESARVVAAIGEVSAALLAGDALPEWADSAGLRGRVCDLLDAAAAMAQDESGPPLVGPGAPETLGPYALGEEIGRGGMAPVYAARDSRLEREVAVKVLIPDVLGRRRRRERFLREARAMARVKHPHVVPIYDVGEQGEWVYLTMERMSGSLQGERPTARQAVRWCVEAARGLAHAHSNGILHRDVKPSNLLLDDEGRVRVCDFGLALRTDEHALTRTGVVLGTPLYASPEQLRGDPLAVTCDVFGLGATLYKLLLGTPPPPPYEEASDYPPLPPSLPAGLRPVLARALAIDPAARFHDMGALAGALERWLAQDRLRTAWRRFGAPALLLLLVGAAVLWWPREAPQAPAARARVAVAPEVSIDPYVVWQGRRADFVAADPDVANIQRRGLDWASLSGPLGQRAPVPMPHFTRAFDAILQDADFEARVVLRRDEGRVWAATYLLERDLFRGAGRLALRSPPVDVDGDGLPETVVVGEGVLAIVKWPLRSWDHHETGWAWRAGEAFGYGSPRVVDWEGDGDPEVLVGGLGAVARPATHEAQVTLLDVRRGVPRQTWTVPGRVQSTPQTARVGDETLVLVDTEDPYGASLPASLQRLHLDGRVQPLVMGADETGRMTWPVIRQRAGGAELVVGTARGRVIAMPVEGPRTPRWTWEAGGPLIANPLVSDQGGPGGEAVCFVTHEALSCLDPEAASEAERVVWRVALPGEARVVAAPAAVPDVTGDGLEEVVVATASGVVHVLSKQAPGGRLGSHRLTNPGRSDTTVVVARPAVLRAADDRPQVVVATTGGVVVALTVDAEGLTPAWRFEAGDPIIAAPVAMPRVGVGGDAVMVASYTGWLQLLVAAPGASVPTVLWGFKARSAIGGTPALTLAGSGHRVLFTDTSGWLYHSRILPPR